MDKENNYEDIYYSKGFQIANKVPAERFLFIQWILDFVCVTEALSSNYNRWYQQLFYIKLAELLKMKCDEIFQKFGKDEYILKVTTCLTKIYDIFSSDECIYITYRRDSAAHPYQSGYDIYNESGDEYKNKRELKIKGNSISFRRESISKAIGRVLVEHGNIDQNCDLKFLEKLSPIILEFKEGLIENHVDSMRFFK